MSELLHSVYLHWCSLNGTKSSNEKYSKEFHNTIKGSMEVKKNAIELLSELIILKLNLSISVPFHSAFINHPRSLFFTSLKI